MVMTDRLWPPKPDGHLFYADDRFRCKADQSTAEDWLRNASRNLHHQVGFNKWGPA